MSIRYDLIYQLVDGVYCSQLVQHPPCLNGHYLNPFVFPIFLEDGSPLTPEVLVKINPTDLNLKRFKSRHHQLMVLPENMIDETFRLAQWQDGETPEVTPPYEFCVTWDYSCKSLSVFAPYQILIPVPGKPSLKNSLDYLKDNLQGAIQEKIFCAKKAWGNI